MEIRDNETRWRSPMISPKVTFQRKLRSRITGNLAEPIMASITADTIIKNGHVITLDAQSSECEAIAIKGTRIIAVGTNNEVADFFSDDCQIIDVEGRSIIPGIIDAHAHMEREGLKSARPSLTGVGSVGEIQACIAKFVQKKLAGEWVITMPVGDPPHYYDEQTKSPNTACPTVGNWMQ